MAIRIVIQEERARLHVSFLAVIQLDFVHVMMTLIVPKVEPVWAVNAAVAI